MRRGERRARRSRRSAGPRLERAMGVEPTLSAWKAEVLPLNYAREGRPPALGPSAGRGAEPASRRARAGRGAQHRTARTGSSKDSGETDRALREERGLVGRGGFEPPKVRTTRFTVWPIWPLWNLPLQVAPPRKRGFRTAAPNGHRRPASAGHRRAPNHSARGGPTTRPRDRGEVDRQGAGVSGARS